MTYKFNLMPDGHGGFIQEPHQPTIATNRTIPISWNDKEIITTNLIGKYKIKRL